MKKLNITFSSSTEENKITVGEFQIECYTSVAKALSDIFEEVSKRIKQPKMKSIDIKIELLK